MNEEDENDLIKGYYFQGFEYKDILRFLYHHHAIFIARIIARKETEKLKKT